MGRKVRFSARLFSSMPNSSSKLENFLDLKMAPTNREGGVAILTVATLNWVFMDSVRCFLSLKFEPLISTVSETFYS